MGNKKKKMNQIYHDLINIVLYLLFIFVGIKYSFFKNNLFLYFVMFSVLSILFDWVIKHNHWNHIINGDNSTIDNMHSYDHDHGPSSDSGTSEGGNVIRNLVYHFCAKIVKFVVPLLIVSH